MSIEVKNLSKHFGQFTALNNVSVTFPTGGLVALLGPSGCGKTSLLRVIAGLERADAGEVFINGQNVQTQDIRQRQVGFVFQHYALFKHMTVFENVAFGLRARPKKQRPNETQITNKVMQLLELVQLGWLAQRYPAQLSGGQRQRVALARALAIEPQVLLLDEPFGALDAKVRKELRRWLRQLHDELHVTSLFVTHDQEEALEVADQVVLMNQGQIEQIGTPEAVYDQPASEFVYRFLGSSNRFTDPNTQKSDKAFVYSRPHEIQLVDTANNAGAMQATIERALSIGPMTRLELQLETEGSLIEVELPRDEFNLKQLKAGDQVWLKSEKLWRFPTQVNNTAA